MSEGCFRLESTNLFADSDLLRDNQLNRFQVLSADRLGPQVKNGP